MLPLARPLLALAALALLHSCAAHLDGASKPNPCSEITIVNSHKPSGIGKIEMVTISYHESGTDRKILLPEMRDYGALMKSEVRACNYAGRAPFLFKYDNQGQVDCNMLDSPRCKLGLEITIRQYYLMSDRAVV